MRRVECGEEKKGKVLNNPGLCSHTAINVEPEGQPTLFCSKTKPGLMRVSVKHKSLPAYAGQEQSGETERVRKGSCMEKEGKRY